MVRRRASREVGREGCSLLDVSVVLVYNEVGEFPVLSRRRRRSRVGQLLLDSIMHLADGASSSSRQVKFSRIQRNNRYVDVTDQSLGGVAIMYEGSRLSLKEPYASLLRF